MTGKRALPQKQIPPHPASVFIFIIILLIVLVLGSMTMWYNVRRPVPETGVDLFKMIKNRFDRVISG